MTKEEAKQVISQDLTNLIPYLTLYPIFFLPSIIGGILIIYSVYNTYYYLAILLVPITVIINTFPWRWLLIYLWE